MKPIEQKILGLLSNHNVTFFIPPFQRNYEWTVEQCEIFWKDVQQTAEKNSSGNHSEHFFGTITYYQTSPIYGMPSTLVLVDGQQRITTTMLFLAALRDELKDKPKKTYINENFLENAKAASDDSGYKIKLKQVETDWAAYKKLILSQDLDEIEKDSAVAQNYTFFREQLHSKNSGDQSLLRFVEQGLEWFSVITIELEQLAKPWENPQEIFESMNSIGKPLSLADLVRNWLLFGFDADQQEKLYRDFWLPMERLLPGRLSGFVRDFMQVRGRRSYLTATEKNYKNLYHEFKNLLSEAKADAILGELSDYAKVYSIILEGNSGHKLVDRILGDLRRLKVTTAYSFLLALLWDWKKHGFSESGLIEILKAFRNYILRRRLLKGITTAENKNFPRLVAALPEIEAASNKTTKLYEVISRSEYATRLPNDDEIATELKSGGNFYSSQYSGFVLSLIEESLTKHLPEEDDELLQKEHIMPQTLSKAWKDYLGTEDVSLHPQRVHTIGNLTLIRHNQELGNRSFDEKKVVYESNSGLQIARTKITDVDKWNIAAIETRTEWLVNLLLQKIADIPDEFRHANNYSVRKQGSSTKFSFEELQLVGQEISFVDDPGIVARVVGDTEVEFEGRQWKLAPLTREIKKRMNACNKSGAYQGSKYWKFEDTLLSDL